VTDEEQKNEQNEETTEQAPAAAEEQAAEEQAPEVPAEEAPAEEPAAEEPAADETPKDEAPKEDEAAAAEADSNGPDDEAAEAEDASSDADDAMEGLDWKARRRLERSRRSGEAGPSQSAEERAAARGERRKANALKRSSYRAKQRTKRQPGTGTPPAERRSAGRKTRQGRVVSSKPDKTITVQIDVARRHPAYEKVIRTSNKLHAHDERNEAGEGDLVRVVETRPISRSKRWRLVEILEKAK
jgi:small subunit ribosomal protein S17